MLTTMTQNKPPSDQPPVSIEPGTTADSYAVFLVFEHAYADLTQRLGITRPTSAADPEALARMWAGRKSMYQHLAETADQFWLAKRGDETVGMARSIVRDDLRLLTEFFIVPGEQSAGLGRQLLSRALPAGDARRRWLLATGDLRAQALYLKFGLYPQFPAYYFWRQPRPLAPSEGNSVGSSLADTGLANTGLEAKTAAPSTVAIEAAGDIDAQLLGHRRDADHRWLLTDRRGYLYYRAGRPVGYGYIGPRSGPFALLNEADYPAVLTHAESEAARLGHGHFGLEVPMVNHTAVDYLLGNGFQIDSFIAQFMSDGPTGRFNNYIMTSPPFIL